MNNLRKLHYFGTRILQKNAFDFCVRTKFKKEIAVCFGQIHTSCRRLDSVKTEKSDILVYEAPLKTRMRVVKLLSLTSSMVGFALFPTVIYDLCKVNILLGVASGAVSTFFLSTPIMLHWITKRYVLELFYDNETQTFTAKTYNIVTQIQEVTFKAEDVTVPDLPGMLSSFLVRGKPLFVDASMVQDPDAYSHMMGYDKPFDLAIKVADQDKSTKDS